MLIYLLLFILFILGAVIIFLANLPGTFDVRVTHSYAQPMQQVFDTLRNFRTWPNWSPWLIHEPDTRLEYSEDLLSKGGNYTWDGNIIGSGKLTHELLQEPTLIQQHLEFIKPYKNTAKTAFELSSNDGKTDVEWILHGSMPFFMRFMVPKMKQMISKDYALGLAMLAGELDPDAEHPRIQFLGEIQLDPMRCLCKGFEGGLTELQAAMEIGYPELSNFLIQEKSTPTAEPRAFYHKVDIKKMWFQCDMAIPVADNFDTGKYPIKNLGGGKYFEVAVLGSYEFLELAWNAAMAHIFMAKLKLDHKRPSFEVYANDPATVAHSNEIKTLLYIPLR